MELFNGIPIPEELDIRGGKFIHRCPGCGFEIKRETIWNIIANATQNKPKLLGLLRAFCSLVLCQIMPCSVVYFAEDTQTNNIKIGFTSNLPQRLRKLKNANHTKIRLLAVVPGNNKLEQALHDKFQSCQVQGEWYKQTAELNFYIIGCLSPWINSSEESCPTN